MGQTKRIIYILEVGCSSSGCSPGRLRLPSSVLTLLSLGMCDYSHCLWLGSSFAASGSVICRLQIYAWDILPCYYFDVLCKVYSFENDVCEVTFGVFMA